MAMVWRITVTEFKAGQSTDIGRHGDIEGVATALEYRIRDYTRFVVA